MSPSERSLRLKKCSALALALFFGCDGAAGTGTVRATFLENECKSGTERELADYSFEADYLATERFSGILQIIVQKHRVEIEEGDGLIVRFSLQQLLESGVLIVDRQQILRADPNAPLVVQTSTSPLDANVSLSLFGTCPEFPTHYAKSGVLTLDKLTLAANPEDTGTGERISGTVTATLSRSSERDPVGTLNAVFDFAPPRRPLTDFK